MTEPLRDQQLLMLGEIKGIVQALKSGQDSLHSRLEAMDGRLRSVEQRAAVTGAVSGGVMGVGVALIIESVRSFLRISGKGP
jgi:hypothetical protein